MRHEAVREHTLRSLFRECTLRCNLHCRHCGSDCKQTAAVADMPTADFLKTVDNITPHINPNKLLVIFTGGEALVRKDLETIERALYDRGYLWGIVTNGMLLSRERLDNLLGTGMHTLTISVDGFEKAHNWIRGHPESFKRASQALEYLAKEEELAWDVVTCVNQKNFRELARFKDFLINRGVKAWRIFTIFPAGRAALAPGLQLSNPEFRELLEFTKDTRKEGRIKLNYCCEGFLGNYEGDVRDSLFVCQAGISAGSVLIDGSISSCPSIRSDFSQGNIHTDDFMSVWNDRFEQFRDREWMRRDECAACSVTAKAEEYVPAGRIHRCSFAITKNCDKRSIGEICKNP